MFGGTDHALGELVGVVVDDVELELDGLVLLVLVAPLLGVEDAQPELDARRRRRQGLVARHHLHLAAKTTTTTTTRSN